MKALEIEVVMCVSRRGTYCRDLLEFSRLLDSFAVLSTPLQITIAVPSASGFDPMAESGLTVGAGQWQGGFTPEFQAEWAEKFVSMALSKPYVNAVYWANLSDAAPHRFPHCGLFDAADQPKLAIKPLHELRKKNLT